MKQIKNVVTIDIELPDIDWTALNIQHKHIQVYIQKRRYSTIQTCKFVCYTNLTNWTHDLYIFHLVYLPINFFLIYHYLLFPFTYMLCFYGSSVELYCHTDHTIRDQTYAPSASPKTHFLYRSLPQYITDNQPFNCTTFV